jgi:hypothetical protein
MRLARSSAAAAPTTLLAFALMLGVSTRSRDARADQSDTCATAAEEAQTLRSQAKLQEARARLLTCANEVCPAVVRKDCIAWLGDLEKLQPTVVLRARDSRGRDVAGVRATVDGVEIQPRLTGTATPLDPGSHRIRFEAASGATVEQTLVVVESEKNRIVTVTFDVPLRDDGTADATPVSQVPLAGSPSPSPSPAPESSRSLAPAFVAAGVGVIALGAFTYFEIVGQSDYARLHDGCGRTRSCSDSEVDSLRRKFVGAGISLGVAALAGGIAAWLFVSRPSEAAPAPASARAPSLDLHVTSGGAVATFARRF